MERPGWSGEFGNEGNPEGARAPRTPAEGEFGGEGNPPGLRPEDADPEREPAGPPDEPGPRRPRRKSRPRGR